MTPTRQRPRRLWQSTVERYDRTTGGGESATGTASLPQRHWVAAGPPGLCAAEPTELQHAPVQALHGLLGLFFRRLRLALGVGDQCRSAGLTVSCRSVFGGVPVVPPYVLLRLATRNNTVKVWWLCVWGDRVLVCGSSARRRL